jgi:hypothetical protein
VILTLVLVIALTATNLGGIWVAHLDRRSAAEERRQLINHLLAKTPSEFTMLQLATAPRSAKSDDEDEAARYRAVVPLGL